MDKNTSYKTGDHVIYLSSGVCRVDDIRDERFGGMESRTYYVMHALSDPRSVIYVPINSEKLLNAMIPILSEDELKKVISQIGSVTIEWLPDIKQRNAHFSEIIASGNRVEIFALFKMLSIRKRELCAQRKKFYAGDEMILNTVSKPICEECTFVLGLHASEVTEYIIENS